MGESFTKKNMPKLLCDEMKKDFNLNLTNRTLKTLCNYQNTLKKLLFLWKPNQVHDFFINIVSQTTDEWTDEELSNDFCEEFHAHLKLMKQSYKDTEKLVELIDEFITVQKNRQLEAKNSSEALIYALPDHHSLQLYKC
jgi:hypothetical protein